MKCMVMGPLTETGLYLSMRRHTGPVKGTGRPIGTRLVFEVLQCISQYRTDSFYYGGKLLPLKVTMERDRQAADDGEVNSTHSTLHELCLKTVSERKPI